MKGGTPATYRKYVPGQWPTCRKQDDMKALVAIPAVLIRLARPTRGWHTGPDTYLHSLRAELRTRRARRVRRYAESLTLAVGVVA